MMLMVGVLSFWNKAESVNASVVGSCFALFMLLPVPYVPYRPFFFLSSMLEKGHGRGTEI